MDTDEESQIRKGPLSVVMSANMVLNVILAALLVAVFPVGTFIALMILILTAAMYLRFRWSWMVGILVYLAAASISAVGLIGGNWRSAIPLVLTVAPLIFILSPQVRAYFDISL